MSQRECAGFNWAGFAVCACDPFGVGPESAHSATVRRLLSVFPAALYVSVAGEPAIGVGQPASIAAMHKSCGARGVGHPVEAMARMRGANARSRENDRPAGVAVCFHVSVYKVEPSKAVRSFNLFAKDWAREALRDEVVPVRP